MAYRKLIVEPVYFIPVQLDWALRRRSCRLGAERYPWGNDIFTQFLDRTARRSTAGSAAVNLATTINLAGSCLAPNISGSWGNVEGSSSNCVQGFDPGETYDCRAKQNWTVQWLNKLGYTFGTDHRLLAYVTGGVAASGLSIDKKYVGVAFGENATEFGSTTFVGGVLGGGFQYAFTNSLSLGVEYLHAEYADSNFTTTISSPSCGGCGLPTHLTATEQFSTDTVRAVLNYKFGEPPEAVPLK